MSSLVGIIILGIAFLIIYLSIDKKTAQKVFLLTIALLCLIFVLIVLGKAQNI